MAGFIIKFTCIFSLNADTEEDAAEKISEFQRAFDVSDFKLAKRIQRAHAIEPLEAVIEPWSKVQTISVNTPFLL